MKRREWEREMDEELRSHIDRYVADLVNSGVERAEAERRARVEFGAIESVKDQCRDAWGLRRLDELRADLRYAVRGIRQNPAFAAVAVLSLALGIGANTAVFGLMDAVMLRVLPVEDPERLVFVFNATELGVNNGGPPYPCFEEMRSRAAAFSGMAAFTGRDMEVIIDGVRERVSGEFVSGDYYRLLGVRPVAGRTLAASDDSVVGKGGPDGPVAVISERWWKQRFGGDRSIIGRTLRMPATTVTVVGVMPSSLMTLASGRPVDIALPMMLTDARMLTERRSWWLKVVGRLKPGAGVESARAELDAIFQNFMREPGGETRLRKYFHHIQLSPAGKGMDDLRGRFARPLTVMMVIVALVLLIACANVANLLLARATARQKEFSVRLALGAARGRLVRQGLTESLLLSGVAALLGLAFASWGQSMLAAYFAEGTQKIEIDLALNIRVLLFTTATALLTALAFGIAPALRATSMDPAARLHASSRHATTSRSGTRTGRALVAVQVALSLVLLGGSALFIRSLMNLRNLDLGFTPENILTMEIAPERELAGTERWLQAQRTLLERVRRVPTVRAAALTTLSPLSGRDRGVLIDVPGFVPQSDSDRDIHLTSVSDGFFETFRMPLVAGRTFQSSDDAAAPRVAILSEAAARLYFGKRDPIGAKFKFWRQRVQDSYEVVGVVRNSKLESLREEPVRMAYLPASQSIDRMRGQVLTVSTTSDPMPLAGALRAELLAGMPSLLITNVSTVERQLDATLLTERLVTTLAVCFAGLALVLASIGLYGVLAYAVARRANEIGIRIALGASARRVTGMVMRDALTTVAAGIVAGIPAVMVLARFAKAILFGVKPADPGSIAAAGALLLAVGAASALVPAWRATRVDPVTALKNE
jgi:predicted permease